MEFKNAAHEELNIYAFVKGLELETLSKNYVRFSFHHIEIYPTRSLVEHFLYYQNLCGIMYSILLNILMW
jgi:hypothetical protein